MPTTAEDTRTKIHYHRYRRRRINNGTWNYPADITTVRAHLHSLRNAGMTITGIAAAANLPPSTIYSIGTATNRAYVYGDTAAAILSVTPRITWPAGYAGLTGTSRRLQALVAIGYTFSNLAPRLGTQPTNLCALAHGRQKMVTNATAAAVKALYAQLSTTPGGSVRAERLAAREGWTPPIAWDDDELDNPDARPHLDDPESQDHVDEYAVELVLTRKKPLTILQTRAERQHVVRELLDRDMTVAEIARHVENSKTVIANIAASLNVENLRPCEVCGDPLDTVKPHARYHQGACAAEGTRRLKVERQRAAYQRQKVAA